MKNNNGAGHILAVITIIIWGITFISTKVLLKGFSPIEILFFRFLIGFLALVILAPRRLRLSKSTHNWLFAAAGMCGITLYYLLENIALTLTTAGNVGTIITIAPFFTALFSMWYLKAGKPQRQFYVGFIVAIAGVTLINFNGSANLHLNPLGDMLAMLAAVTWAGYSTLTRKIGELGYDTILATRRIFVFGLVFMLPALFLMDFHLGLDRLKEPLYLSNVLFLGLGASALCFVTWNTAVKWLGAVRTSVYIYLVPVITVTAAVIILGETLTPLLCIGIVLTLTGLWLSETKFFATKRKRKSSNLKNTN